MFIKDWKKEIMTIPNLLSLFRLILIPVYITIYLNAKDTADYYIAAGVDFNIESYESLAKWFIKEYQPASMKCGLFEGIVDTFKYLKDKGYYLYQASLVITEESGIKDGEITIDGVSINELDKDNIEILLNRL